MGHNSSAPNSPPINVQSILKQDIRQLFEQKMEDRAFSMKFENPLLNMSPEEAVKPLELPSEEFVVDLLLDPTFLTKATTALEVWRDVLLPKFKGSDENQPYETQLIDAYQQFMDQKTEILQEALADNQRNDPSMLRTPSTPSSPQPRDKSPSINQDLLDLITSPMDLNKSIPSSTPNSPDLSNPALTAAIIDHIPDTRYIPAAIKWAAYSGSIEMLIACAAQATKSILNKDDFPEFDAEIEFETINYGLSASIPSYYFLEGFHTINDVFPDDSKTPIGSDGNTIAFLTKSGILTSMSVEGEVYATQQIPQGSIKHPINVVCSEGLVYIAGSKLPPYDILTLKPLEGNYPRFSSQTTSDGKYIYTVVKQSKIQIYQSGKCIRTVTLSRGKSDLMNPYQRRLFPWKGDGKSFYLSNGVTFTVLHYSAQGLFQRTFSLLDGTHICDSSLSLPFPLRSVTFDGVNNCLWAMTSSGGESKLLKLLNPGASPPWVTGYPIEIDPYVPFVPLTWLDVWKAIQKILYPIGFHLAGLLPRETQVAALQAASFYTAEHNEGFINDIHSEKELNGFIFSLLAIGAGSDDISVFERVYENRRFDTFRDIAFFAASKSINGAKFKYSGKRLPELLRITGGKRDLAETINFSDFESLDDDTYRDSLMLCLASSVASGNLTSAYKFVSLSQKMIERVLEGKGKGFDKWAAIAHSIVSNITVSIGIALPLVSVLSLKDHSYDAISLFCKVLNSMIDVASNEKVKWLLRVSLTDEINEQDLQIDTDSLSKDSPSKKNILMKGLETVYGEDSEMITDLIIKTLEPGGSNDEIDSILSCGHRSRQTRGDIKGVARIILAVFIKHAGIGREIIEISKSLGKGEEPVLSGSFSHMLSAIGSVRDVARRRRQKGSETAFDDIRKRCLTYLSLPAGKGSLSKHRIDSIRYALESLNPALSSVNAARVSIAAVLAALKSDIPSYYMEHIIAISAKLPMRRLRGKLASGFMKEITSLPKPSAVSTFVNRCSLLPAAADTGSKYLRKFSITLGEYLGSIEGTDRSLRTFLRAGIYSLSRPEPSVKVTSSPVSPVSEISEEDDNYRKHVLYCENLPDTYFCPETLSRTVFLTSLGETLNIESSSIQKVINDFPHMGCTIAGNLTAINPIEYLKPVLNAIGDCLAGQSGGVTTAARLITVIRGNNCPLSILDFILDYSRDPSILVPEGYDTFCDRSLLLGALALFSPAISSLYSGSIIINGDSGEHFYVNETLGGKNILATRLPVSVSSVIRPIKCSRIFSPVTNYTEGLVNPRHREILEAESRGCDLSSFLAMTSLPEIECYPMDQFTLPEGFIEKPFILTRCAREDLLRLIDRPRSSDPQGFGFQEISSESIIPSSLCSDALHKISKPSTYISGILPDNEPTILTIQSIPEAAFLVGLSLFSNSGNIKNIILSSSKSAVYVNGCKVTDIKDSLSRVSLVYDPISMILTITSLETLYTSQKLIGVAAFIYACQEPSQILFSMSSPETGSDETPVVKSDVTLPEPQNTTKVPLVSYPKSFLTHADQSLNINIKSDILPIFPNPPKYSLSNLDILNGQVIKPINTRNYETLTPEIADLLFEGTLSKLKLEITGEILSRTIAETSPETLSRVFSSEKLVELLLSLLFVLEYFDTHDELIDFTLSAMDPSIPLPEVLRTHREAAIVISETLALCPAESGKAWCHILTKMLSDYNCHFTSPDHKGVIFVNSKTLENGPVTLYLGEKNFIAYRCFPLTKHKDFVTFELEEGTETLSSGILLGRSKTITLTLVEPFDGSIAILPLFGCGRDDLQGTPLSILVALKYFSLTPYIPETPRNHIIDFWISVIDSLTLDSPIFNSYPRLILNSLKKLIPITSSDLKGKLVTHLNYLAAITDAHSTSVPAAFLRAIQIEWDEAVLLPLKTLFPEFMTPSEAASATDMNVSLPVGIPSTRFPDVLDLKDNTDAFAGQIARLMDHRVSLAGFPFHLILRFWAEIFSQYPEFTLIPEGDQITRLEFPSWVPQTVDIKSDTDIRISLTREFTEILISPYPTNLPLFVSGSFPFLSITSAEPSDVDTIITAYRETFVSDMKRLFIDWPTSDDKAIFESVPIKTYTDKTITLRVPPSKLYRAHLTSSPRLLSIRGSLLFACNWLLHHSRGDPKISHHMSIPLRSLNFLALVDNFSHNTLPDVTVDRRLATLVRIGSSSDLSQTLISQLASLNHPDSFYRCRGDRPWNVKFVEEKGYDGGGPARELLSEVFREMTETRCGLFAPAGDFYIPLPDPGVREPEKVMRMCGVLIGVCIRSGIAQPLPLPLFAWNYLATGKVDPEEVLSLDPTIASKFSDMQNNETLTDSEFIEKFTQRFSIESLRGEEVPLGPRGYVVPSTLNEYISRAEGFRVGEIIPHLESVREGLWGNLGFPVPSIVSGELLQRLTCGIGEITAEEFIEKMVYEGIPIQQRRYFEKVVEEMEPSQRSSLLRFATGRVILPAGKAVRVDRMVGAKDRLPSATTCFSQLHLPNYSSYAVAKKMIEIAIDYTGTFENG